MNKISLIIPDLHHRWQDAENIIESVNHDEVIFLGDYFDDFNDTPEMMESTCDWLNGSVKKSNRIHLFGNHDVHYAFPYRRWKCSGYEQWKDFITTDNIPRTVWDKLKWYHVLDNTWLLTHAGLHKFNVPEEIQALHTDREKFFPALTNHLDISIQEGFQLAANNVPSWVFGAGRSRGGANRVGGITWCDFDREFTPIKGLNQIFGHTPQTNGSAEWYLVNELEKITYATGTDHKSDHKILADPNVSENLCLDVWKRTHYAVWDGKSLTIGAVKR